MSACQRLHHRLESDICLAGEMRHATAVVRLLLSVTKVLYIAGAGRSGSTLLGLILGQLEGFAVGGELYNFPLRFLERQYCGCGKRLPECPFWQQVLSRCFGSAPEMALETWVRQRHDLARTRHTLAWSVPLTRQYLLRHSDGYRTTLERFYRAISEAANARVVVDTSKVSGYAQVLAWTSCIDLYVVHLVRDPRAVAYSWARLRPKQTPSGYKAIPTTSPLDGVLRWLAHNLATELYRSLPGLHYLRVRYEEFVREPQQTLQNVLSFIDERSPIPLDIEGKVVIYPQHTVGGNPDRFRNGLVEIIPDDEWLSKLRLPDRFLVTAVAAPLMLRYGYTINLHS